MKNKNLAIVPIEIIENKIYLIRNAKVMLDKDLAFLYQVKPIALRQQVRRNKERFPKDFMFQLTNKEVDFLVSQNVIPSRKVLGGALPYAFTEHGVTMLSSVLKSKKAIEVNIAIIRAFIKLREMLQSHKDVLIEIEKIKRNQKKDGEKISAIIDVINKLMEPKADLKRKSIGFKTGK
ncbi:MAG: ORF6N domain-containing protein [Candidatus Pacebacteria bacterium]|nr:ORF6N domain-containing protein [Candidatus Paceibacterota bacterium]